MAQRMSMHSKLMKLVDIPMVDKEMKIELPQFSSRFASSREKIGRKRFGILFSTKKHQECNFVEAAV